MGCADIYGYEKTWTVDRHTLLGVTFRTKEIESAVLPPAMASSGQGYSS
jgi:hypothetical protein